MTSTAVPLETETNGAEAIVRATGTTLGCGNDDVTNDSIRIEEEDTELVHDGKGWHKGAN